MAVYVTPAQVAAELALAPAAATAAADRLQRCCDAAAGLVDATLERPTADPLPTPPPALVVQAALEVAVDLFRSPAASFGYYSTDLALASIGPDRVRRVVALLAPYKHGIGVA